jgi:hypothetical protein
MSFIDLIFKMIEFSEKRKMKRKKRKEKNEKKKEKDEKKKREMKPSVLLSHQK